MLIQFGRRLSVLSPRAKLFLMVGADAVFLPFCAVLAVALRLGSLTAALELALPAQLALGLATLPVLGIAGLYRAVVRYIDLRVLISAGAALAAAVALVYATAYVLDMSAIPRSSVLVYWFIAFSYVVSSRFLARSLLRRGLKPVGRARIRTAIYGAGEAGAQLAYSMAFSTEYRAVCFLDDRGTLRGKTVAGLKVYSPDDIAEAVFRHEVDQIVVAIPSAGSTQKRQLIRRVEKTGLPVKILPSLTDMVDGRVRVADIREIDLIDLLGRDPVPPDPKLFARNITGKVVLVTGAGGSIGSELCRQILSQDPAKLVLLDHAEFNLYSIEQELRQLRRSVVVEAVLGSVQDGELLERTMRTHGVQTAYHAAAYKHVPIVEANVRQGVLNNVFGTLAVARAAQACGLETCVLVSTDKAVRPTNVMGASKRVAELIFQAAAARRHSATIFSIVRFGNVLGSSGSVVPLFKRQIQDGGPVTITHPDIVRYFMLIPEAAQLVIQAGAMAHGGEVFVLDMGEPVRIADLARTIIHLSGLSERTPERPDGDIELQFIGLRPGEKLFEELLIGDSAIPSGHPRILSAKERLIEHMLLDKMLGSLRKACEELDDGAVMRQIRNLVPEYRDADDVNAAALAQDYPHVVPTTAS